MTITFPFAAPQWGANIDMGVGKTEATIDLALGLLEAHADARILYTVPTHALADELASRCNNKAGKIIAGVWKGIGQPDPNQTGQTMCRNLDAAVEAIKAGGSLKALCGSDKRGFCPHHPQTGGGCAYRRQGEHPFPLWISAHSMLRAVPPGPLKRAKVKAKVNGTMVEYQPDPFDLVVIDEAPWLGFTRGFDRPYGVSMRDVGWHPTALNNDSRGVADTDHYAELCAKVGHRLANLKHGDRLPREAFEAEGLSVDDARQLRGHLYAAKVDVDALLRPGMSKDDVGTALKEAITINGKIMRLAQFWRLVRLLLESDSEVSPNLRVGDVPRPSGSDAGVLMRWREEIHPAYSNAPILHLDGTMNERIARQFLPRMEVIADLRVVAPYARRVQVYDTIVSYRKIAPGPGASAKDQITQENNVRLIGRAIEAAGAHLARGRRRGLAIMPQKTENALVDLGLATKAGVNGRVSVGAMDVVHFGAVAGRDDWKDVATQFVIGRPEIPPRQAEDLAEVIFGKVPQSLGEAWYSKRPAGALMRCGAGASLTQIYHPDPDVESIRQQVTEAQLLQAEARARGARRDADHPVEIIIVTSVPLALEIDALVTWDEVMALGDPLPLMIARGVVPSDYKGMAAVLPDYFAGAKSPENAARKWFHRNPTSLELLKQLFRGEFVPNSQRKVLIGVWDKLEFVLFRYRRIGQRKSALVLIARHHFTDNIAARSVVQTLFGDLDIFEQVAERA